MSVKVKEVVNKQEVKKPELSWLEITAIVYLIEHLKDKKMGKLGLNPNRLNAIRRAQKKMTDALEVYIENGK
jgi:hypothetical protein